MPRHRSDERKHTDASLRVEREKVDRALAEALAAIDETADAVISLARERADRMLAATRARTGAPLSTTVREDQALREERARADETVRAARAEHVARFAIGRKETDADLLSERVRADDSLATRDEFLGVVSHDLRNMLNTIVGFAELIAADVRDGHVAKVLGHAERIQRSGVRMNRLIGDLVDIASIEAGALRVTRSVGDPSHVVTEAVDTFQAQAALRGVVLACELVPLPPAAFEPARILQVLANLLSNAIKFSPQNGNVVVRVEAIGQEIRFSVRDPGPGIPADKLEVIFERFLQIGDNDRRGVGLGLYISKSIVQGHGGRIWAESTIGEGNTFCFTLPIHAPAQS